MLIFDPFTATNRSELSNLSPGLRLVTEICDPESINLASPDGSTRWGRMSTSWLRAQSTAPMAGITFPTGGSDSSSAAAILIPSQLLASLPYWLDLDSGGNKNSDSVSSFSTLNLGVCISIASNLGNRAS